MIFLILRQINCLEGKFVLESFPFSFLFTIQGWHQFPPYQLSTNIPMDVPKALPHSKIFQKTMQLPIYCQAAIHGGQTACEWKRLGRNGKDST